MNTDPAAIESSSEAKDFFPKFDLIDFIAFFWRWRTFLLIGTCLGSSVGLLQHYLSSRNAVESYIINYQSTEDILPEQIKAEYQALVANLNPKVFSTIFRNHLHELMREETDVAYLDHFEFLEASIDTDKIVLKTSAENHFSTIKAKEKAIILTINELIQRFNADVKKYFSIRDEIFVGEFSRAKIETQALNLFIKYSKISKYFQNILIETLSQSHKDEVRARHVYAMFLAEVPDDDKDKIAWFSSYQKENEDLKLLEKEKNNLVKLLGTEEPLYLPLIKKSGIEISQMSGQAFSIKKILKNILVGSYIGVILALCWGVVLNFFRKNRAKIFAATQKKWSETA